MMREKQESVTKLTTLQLERDQLSAKLELTQFENTKL